MIDGQFFLGKFVLAILANMIVAQKDILPGQAHGEREIGPDVLFQAHHCG